jgi:hypothetical protein
MTRVASRLAAAATATATHAAGLGLEVLTYRAWGDGPWHLAPGS